VGLAIFSLLTFYQTLASIFLFNNQQLFLFSVQNVAAIGLRSFS